jgi:hypothetical protein
LQKVQINYVNLEKTLKGVSAAKVDPSNPLVTWEGGNCEILSFFWLAHAVSFTEKSASGLRCAGRNLKPLEELPFLF